MKTYEIIQLVEVTKSFRITADSAEEANAMATGSFLVTLRQMRKKFPELSYGDIQDDYVPAREPDPNEIENPTGEAPKEPEAK